MLPGLPVRHHLPHASSPRLQHRVVGEGVGGGGNVGLSVEQRKVGGWVGGWVGGAKCCFGV